MRREFFAERESSLYELLYEWVSGVPRDRIKIQVKRGEVRVNGKKQRSDCKIDRGDKVEIFLPSKFDSADIAIVYEDDNVLIADKPPYVESEKQLPQLIYEQTGERVTAVHRLDTNTTGLKKRDRCRRARKGVRKR